MACFGHRVARFAAHVDYGLVRAEIHLPVVTVGLDIARESGIDLLREQGALDAGAQKPDYPAADDPDGNCAGDLPGERLIAISLFWF